MNAHQPFWFKDSSKYQQTLSCPLGSWRLPLQERLGARLRHVMAAVRGAAAAGDRAALTRLGQTQPPGPTAAGAMPALQRPCLPLDIRPRSLWFGTRAPCSNCFLWTLVWVSTPSLPQHPLLTLCPSAHLGCASLTAQCHLRLSPPSLAPSS